MPPTPDAPRSDRRAREWLEMYVTTPPPLDDPGTTVVVELVRDPAPGLAAAAVDRRTQRGVLARIEFPMGVVDPAAVALLQRLIG